MLFFNNLLLFFVLVLATLFSIVVRFAGHDKYIALLVLGLALVAFHIAAPITRPSMLFRLWKKRRIAKDGAKA
jgi:hypothetical protein